MPEPAQMTNFEVLKIFTRDIIEEVLQIQRSKPWGVYWPPTGGEE